MYTNTFIPKASTLEVKEYHKDESIRQIKTYSLLDKVSLFLFVDPNIHDAASPLCLIFDVEYMLQSGSSKSRFNENDELKYSMRSVLKHAPWVRQGSYFVRA